ncbi:hypothetical protein ACFSL4_04765 [Streptomyces caeni]|uniref:Uncharacterized protein n=1 Tax=Streptomyces caeni TaxID=2307231 RepID=A0ABW4IJS7_9ACTN
MLPEPARDLGRVIARATMATPVRVPDEPVVFGERSFTEGCPPILDPLFIGWSLMAMSVADG